MRQAGQVDIAMCEAAIEAIQEDVPEYEITLAVMAAGTRKAAEFLTDKGPERLYTPMIHALQIMQTGGDLHMVHRRPTIKKVKPGESIYLCFCGMIDFKNVKLGFDRQYYLGSCTKEEERIYDIAIRAQKAALDHIRPGVTAESVNDAAVEVYQEEGFGVCYRTGRGVGFSNLERPEFKIGDKTILKAGMTFACDGAVSIPNGPAGRVGDSIIVTEDGFEYITPFPKEKL
jgi:Xaa-Pro aminopeptidase